MVSNRWLNDEVINKDLVVLRTAKASFGAAKEVKQEIFQQDVLNMMMI